MKERTGVHGSAETEVLAHDRELLRRHRGLRKNGAGHSNNRGRDHGPKKQEKEEITPQGGGAETRLGLEVRLALTG